MAGEENDIAWRQYNPKNINGWPVFHSRSFCSWRHQFIQNNKALLRWVAERFITEVVRAMPVINRATAIITHYTMSAVHHMTTIFGRFSSNIITSILVAIVYKCDICGKSGHWN